MLVAIDCGTGNLGSLARAFAVIGERMVVTNDARVVARASRIVLPGVGAFAYGMKVLVGELREVLRARVLEDRVPVLGICLGHQLLTRFSEEGGVPGLGWIEAKTVRIESSGAGRVKVPHIGWNEIRVRRNCPLLEGLPESACFYFAHSYCVRSDNEAVAATTTYGCTFASVLHHGNVFGTQFHPERSQKNGLLVLRNFLAV